MTQKGVRILEISFPLSQNKIQVILSPLIFNHPYFQTLNKKDFIMFTNPYLNCSSRRPRRRNDCDIKRANDESMSAVIK